MCNKVNYYYYLWRSEMSSSEVEHNDAAGSRYAQERPVKSMRSDTWETIYERAWKKVIIQAFDGQSFMTPAERAACVRCSMFHKRSLKKYTRVLSPTRESLNFTSFIEHFRCTSYQRDCTNSMIMMLLVNARITKLDIAIGHNYTR